MTRYSKKLPKMFDKAAFDNMMKKHCPDLTPEKIAHLDEDEELQAYIKEHNSWEHQLKLLKDYILNEEFRWAEPPSHSFDSVVETRNILIEHNEWTPEMQKIYEKVQKEQTRR